MKKIHIAYKRVKKICIYYTCSVCGARLAADETCDCEKGGAQE